MCNKLKKKEKKEKIYCPKKEIIITLISYVGLKHKKGQKHFFSMNGSNFLQNRFSTAVCFPFSSGTTGYGVQDIQFWKAWFIISSIPICP